MIDARWAAVFTGAASFATLVLVVFATNSLVEGSMDIRDVQTNEHADDIVPASSFQDLGIGESIINLNGYWKKSVVTVSFFPAGISQPQFDQIVDVLKGSMNVTQAQQPSNSTQVQYDTWPDLLDTLAIQSKNVPALQLIEPNSEGADIKVFLEAGTHPEGKQGSAKIARDKATFEILTGEIHIYSSHELYKQGFVELVFQHELGHALGLGHADPETSIMHTPLIIVNNTATGEIRNCEADAASSLYIDQLVREVRCVN